MSDKDYFKRAVKFSLLDEIAFYARRRIFKIFMDTVMPLQRETMVDVGVFGGSADPNWNFLEQLYEYPENITAVGIEDASVLELQYPGLKFVKVAPNTPLPFKEDQFDIGFSSAIRSMGALKSIRTKSRAADCSFSFPLNHLAPDTAKCVQGGWATIKPQPSSRWSSTSS